MIASAWLPKPQTMPQELLQAPRWLLWKYLNKPGQAKPAKMPYYCNGRLRGQGLKLDSPEDIAQLESFSGALAKFAEATGRWSGVGFAIVQGEGVGGIDVDDCLNGNGQIVNELATKIYDSAKAAGCYCEVSPSGKGLRIIGRSTGFASFNRGGFEAYSGARFLTITGNVMANSNGFGQIDTTVKLMDWLMPAKNASAASRGVFASTVQNSFGEGVYEKPDQVAQGGRNDAVLRYVSHLRGSGVPENIIPECVSQFNKLVCVPPLDDQEISNLVGRYRPKLFSASPADWPRPKEIKEALLPVPGFDLQVLPTTFQSYVKDTAELMQAPLDYVAIPLMISAAAAIGNTLAIAPKALDINWLVTPVLWGGIVGRPGMKKSPAMDKAVVHLKTIEDDMEAAQQLNVQRYHTDKIIYDAAVAKAKSSARAGLMLAVLPPEPKFPEPERLVVHDSTYQKLTDLLQWSARGLLVVKDELVGLLESLASDGQEGARAFYLQGWNGNSQYKVDRVGRGSLVIKRLAIWLVGGIQPGKLKTYVRQAVHGGNGDDGLLQRFQLLVWPDTAPEWTNLDRTPDLAAFDEVERTFKYLRALDPISTGARLPLVSGPAYLHFSTQAQLQYDAMRSTLEISLRRGNRHPALESHFAKYPSLLASLALVIHLAEGGTGQVGHASVCKAGKWIVYLGAHAKRTYAIATNGAGVSAKALADKIKAGALLDGFSAREVDRKQWSQLTTPLDVKAAIEWLVDANWLKEVDGRSGGTGKVTYSINPQVLGVCQ